MAWARQCIYRHGADMICLQLISADPNGMNRPSDEVAATVKRLSDALEVPLIVWGCENEEKDAEVLRKVADQNIFAHVSPSPCQPAGKN